MRFKGKVPIDR